MAARFWVGGTGTWDAADTTHWSATSNGAGGASVPGSTDTVTFDSLSGGGTVTVNFGGLITLQSLDCISFTGTLDFATNNNSVTLTTSGNAFAGGGTATKTINMGNGTWTLSSGSSTFSLSGANANLTFNANSSTVAFTGTSGQRTVIGGGKTFNAITVAGRTGSGFFYISNSSALTASSLTVSAPNTVIVGPTTTLTTLNVSGTSSSSTVSFVSANPTAGNISVPVTNNYTGNWCSYSFLTFSGGTHTSNNSFGNNVSGITINGPSGGGSSVVGVIGS